MSKHWAPCPRCDGTGYIMEHANDVFGGNVLRLRAAKGWTQAELSSQTGIGRAQIANIESGRSGTTIPGILSLAEALDVSTDALLLPSDSETEPT